MSRTKLKKYKEECVKIVEALPYNVGIAFDEDPHYGDGFLNISLFYYRGEKQLSVRFLVRGLEPPAEYIMRHLTRQLNDKLLENCG